MEKRILALFTRTPLHIGAGSSVGAIDQPIQRERHTGFPVIPASGLKGVFADEWTEILPNPKRAGESTGRRTKDGTWLFGAEDAENASAGAIMFGEAKILAFPVRSARGAFAWITCPTILRRAARDGALKTAGWDELKSLPDENAMFSNSGSITLKDNNECKIVLEEYCFAHHAELPQGLAEGMQGLLSTDPVWSEISSRLAVLSDGMMTHFSVSSCEVAQHVRINDATGTAAKGGLFNQENVPSEAMFYSPICFCAESDKRKSKADLRGAEVAAKEFSERIESCGGVFQFGGDGSTGLGYCTVKLI